MPDHAHVLIVANRTAATPALIEAVRERAGRGPCAFSLLVPQLVAEEAFGEDEARKTIELASRCSRRPPTARCPRSSGPPTRCSPSSACSCTSTTTR